MCNYIVCFSGIVTGMSLMYAVIYSQYPGRLVAGVFFHCLIFFTARYYLHITEELIQLYSLVPMVLWHLFNATASVKHLFKAHCMSLQFVINQQQCL